MMQIEQGDDVMATTRGLARYDQARLLTGNLLTGVGVEVDQRIDGLRSEAAQPRPATGLRRRLGLAVIRLGEAVSGGDVRPAERPAPAR